MGNQLVGIAPSQIFPVEHYFSGTFGTQFIFDSKMGSTRFFKVAKAKSDEGLVVVKVFVKHDPTLPLDDHKNRVEYIKTTLQNAVNCLPFQRVEITDKSAYIIREYVKHSLYDRVSTRPFLTVLEKKWITFQILCALHQCHKQKICHGDIKLENILITSWNWILLSDFASFKPTYLPDDNPADYTYFFDTSRRRTCYIAPERFVQSNSSEELHGDSPIIDSNDSLVRLGSYYSGNNLQPAMDIFSAGCALLELWTEGTAPFELSQLLAYRKGERELVEKHLSGIENEELRDLLASMIDVNPKNRKSAEDYLDQERDKLFPEYFYTFLQPYLQLFSSLPIMSLDDKIIRLHSDIDHCIKVLTEKAEKAKAKNPNESMCPEHDGLILIISVVTSCIRGLQYCNTKIRCLEILEKLSKYTTSDTILDRILPYILHLSQDSVPRVQVQAIETLTACLTMVRDIPRSDANVFPEYILPSIASLSTDPSTIVRVNYAKNIATLAKTAMHFLEETQWNAPNEMTMARYDAELNALHDIVQQTVLSLLTDQQAIVKQTLIESGICELCSFFGKQKANDIVLSHMVTFLNDKQDKNLRGSFFDCIVGVVGYVGWQSSEILIPLLQQGLTDSEEFVITKAIRATTALVDLGHIQKPLITSFISESACYLTFPNLWIRHEMVDLISTTAKKLSPIDVQCKIMPAIRKYLKRSLIQVERPEILLDCLHEPIPRGIFESVLRYADVESFFHALEERKEVRSKVSEGCLPQYEEMETPLKNFFRRLNSESLTEFIEMQLLDMKPFIIKLNKYKSQEQRPHQNGRICLTRKDVICHEYPLSDKTHKLDGGSGSRKTTRSDIDEISSNMEWQHIFDGPSRHLQLTASPSNDLGTSPMGHVSSPAGGGQLHPTASSSLTEYSIPDRNFWQERPSDCRLQLDRLKGDIKTNYMRLVQNQSYRNELHHTAFPRNWRMSGTLVAHLHEHSGSVIKLAPLKPGGSTFVSCSTDGTVRLWDCNKLNGSECINKSRQTYCAKTPIYSVAACDGESLAVGCDDGNILIMRIDRNSSKMALQQALDTSDDKDGAVVDMVSFDQSSPNVIIYATLYGAIVAWDTRMQTAAWRLQNDLKTGVITAICADPTGSWLATGTSGGRHICWDLRFGLPIADIKHPSDSWIRKVACHPTEPSCLISASQSNNEVSVWNIETGHRQTVLWASPAPVLSVTSVNNPSTSCGIYPGIVDNSPFVLTGSSDHRIRYWDLANPDNSSLVVPSAKDNLSEVAFKYNSRLIDGSRVIEENIVNLNNMDMATMRNSSDDKPRSGPDMPSVSHKDAITDLLMCKTERQQTFIVSSARDGVIKIWK